MKSAIVIGTGAGGAMIAKELQGEYQVIMLESGGEFHPFSLPMRPLELLRKSGLFFDERLISLILPNMKIHKTKDMVIVSGKGIGGTTTLATGNAVRYDKDLKELGINLDEEFEELYNELPITTNHQKRWNQTTKQMFELFEKEDLNPVVTPKFLDDTKCINCGHCAIGCPVNAKWDTRQLVSEAIQKGAKLHKKCKVEKLNIENGKVKSVVVKKGLKTIQYQADLIVLSAGGLNTPVILENSGIKVKESLFVDPVLCVGGYKKGMNQEKQLLMPFISQQDHYILSPYIDYLSFFFNHKWFVPMKGLVSIMIKLSDEEIGNIKDKRVLKTMSTKDHIYMKKAIDQSSALLEKMGIKKDDQFIGTLNAGHPGGMYPLTRNEKETLHHDTLPDNLYIADATLIPKSMGNPPILTIMALSKKISKVIKNKFK